MNCFFCNRKICGVGKFCYYCGIKFDNNKTIKFTGQSWCYDFDGVVHLSMKDRPEEKFNKLNTSRHPDGTVLGQFIADFKNLIPHVFYFTIHHMLYGQNNGAEIKIVSANSWNLQPSIFNLLTHFGINIKEKNIFMNENNKYNRLNKINATVFVDDSCKNIVGVHSKQKEIPTLHQLIYVVPERKEYYNIDLHNPLDILCQNIPVWTSMKADDFESNVVNGKIKGVLKMETPYFDPPSPKHVPSPIPGPVLTDNITLLTYNIYGANNYKYNTKRNNVRDYFNVKNADIVSLQEANYDISSDKYEYFDDIIGKYGQYTTRLLIKKSKFNIVSPPILGKDLVTWTTHNLNHRGIVGVRIQHTVLQRNILVIGFHLEHIGATSGKNSVAKTKALFEEILSRLDYNPSDLVIMLGDSNEYYENLPNKTIDLTVSGNKLSIRFKLNGPSCCRTNNGNIKYYADIIGSNDSKLDVKVDNNNPPGPIMTTSGYTHSDHKPVNGNLLTSSVHIPVPPVPVPVPIPVGTQYSLYLVPNDYRGYIKKYWQKWGGDKPHITLISFQSDYNLDQMKIMATELAKNSLGKLKRWVLGRKGSVKTSGKLRLLEFKSKTLLTKLYKLRNTYPKLKLKFNTKDILHLTVGELKGKYSQTYKEDEILKNIQACKDWKIVIVERKSGSVRWLYMYNFYD